MAKAKGSRKGVDLRATLREAALAYPGAWEDHPWGEIVVKVGKKVFVFLGHEASETVGGSFKLPRSGESALMLPFASPTGYGLGKAGWVTAQFARAEDAPLPLLLEWLDESYRAVAPKKSVKELDARAAK